MRPLFLSLHRWIGLAVLLFLLIAGLTGSVIAFHRDIDRALNGDWFTVVVPERSQALSIDALVAAAVEAVPGSNAGFVPLRLKDEDSQMVGVSRLAPLLADGSKGDLQRLQVFLNPYTGAILGVRERNALNIDRRHIVGFLYKLHYSLHLGQWGVWFFGGVAVLWLLDHFAAVALSFPKLTAWKKSFTFARTRNPLKLSYDAHRAGGLWLLPVLATLALSGIAMNLPDPFRAVVGWFSAVRPNNANVLPKLAIPSHDAAFGYATALATAAAAQPERRATGLNLDASRGVYRVIMQGRDDIADYGMTHVYVSTATGRLVTKRLRADESGGDTFLAWQFPLHSGRAFGIFGQILICITGLVVATLSGTGLYLWVKRRRARAGSYAPHLVTNVLPQNVVIRRASDST